MYSIGKIAEKIAHTKQLLPAPQHKIGHILTDSRSLLHPEETLFFAFRTNSGDGHRYIDELFEHGVRNFVVAHNAILSEAVLAESNILFVRDSLKALQQLAQAWREEFAIPVIAITGSNGKTITKEFLYQMLSPHFRTIRSPRSYNSQLGVPLSLLKMRSEDELAIFEAGISQPAEMDRLATIIQPRWGIFTNIGAAHQENFTDLEEKIDEKLNLFKQCETIIYNADEPAIKEGLQRAGLLKHAVAWSVKETEERERAFLQVCEINKNSPSLNTTTLVIHCQGEEYQTTIPFIDEASIKDTLHAITLVAKEFPSILSDVLASLDRLEPVKMRLELQRGERGNVVINDTYNNDVNSLSIALDFLRLRAEQGGMQRVVILSDILQSALTPKNLYRGVGEKIQKYGCDFFVGVGKELSRYASYFSDVAAKFFPTTEALLASGLLESFSNAAILVKGARKFQFETVAEELQERGHVTTLEVNLQSYKSNLDAYRAILPKGTKVMAMIKANAYGLGAYETALAMQEAGVDYLAVALADEGKLLRQRGIYLPIVVMDASMKEIDTLIDYHLEPVIHAFHQFHHLLSHVDREGFTGFPVHIELDTGMHRLGFSTDSLQALAREVADQRILEVKSIFTHLAATDLSSEDQFTKAQIATYKEGYETLVANLGYRPLRHMLNTAGCERFSQEALDMVRLGIGLYGVSPTERLALQPVVKLRTTLIQITDVPPMGTIGYERKGLLAQGGKVGIIPIGYADGYDRRFGNGVGKVTIGGEVFPTIGNICMDLTMIDLSQAKNKAICEGDEVLLIGGEQEIDLSHMAKAIGSIPYEIIAKLSDRIKRIYYRE